MQEHLTDIDKKVNDNDILKEWLDSREETYLCYMANKDKKNNFKFDEFRENILRMFLTKIKSMLRSNLT